MPHLKTLIKSYIEETRASLSVEAVLVFPILAWAFVAMYVFFDGYRAQNTNLKAAYTIGDVLSRETDPVGPDYIKGLDALFTYLAKDSSDAWIRVSVVKWDKQSDRYVLIWSKNTKPAASASLLNPEAVKSKLPELADQDNVIVVETHAAFDPLFNVGLSDVSLSNFIVTSPRFAPTLLWDDDL